MSVGSIGTLGTSDDQAQNAWDLGSAFYTLVGTQTGQQVSPVLNVSAWHSLVLATSPATNPYAVELQWFVLPNATQILGDQIVRVDPSMTATCYMQVPNRGPFLAIITTPASPSTVYVASLYAMPTNRIHPVTVPPIEFLLHEFAPALAAGASATDYATSYYGGPVGVRTNGGSQGVTVQVQTLDSNLAYANVESFTVATNIEDYRTLILPPSASRVVVTNSSGASANNSSRVVMTASQTGSS